MLEGDKCGWISLKGAADLLGETPCDVKLGMLSGRRVVVQIDFGDKRLCEDHGWDFRLFWREVEDAA